MPRVQGWTERQIRGRERVFEALVAKATRLTSRRIALNLNAALTAAVTVSLEPTEPVNGWQPAGGAVAATWNAAVDAELLPYVVDTFVDSARDVHTGLATAGVAAPKITYDLAADYLAAARNRLVGVGDLIWNAVRVQLSDGYALGESTHQLAARVRDVVDVTAPRANTIARTEVVAAANAASLLQVKLAGFDDQECRKTWIATDDERTRIAHHQADGQVVALSKPFIVGGEGLQFPGDPIGRPDNVINCRCTLGYVFADDEDDADDAGPLVASGRIRKWLSWLHPRDKKGRFAETTGAGAPPATPFRILPKAQRGRSGDGYYAPGVWGKFGASGLLMRHVGEDGTPRYMIVQRTRGGKKSWLWQLPGGARDELETPEQAAARETWEEIGFGQDYLARLRRRASHHVELQAEGKPPWRYTTIVADVPYAAKPDVDYHELGAARWLTAEQLYEMRGRGRLVPPFADQLDALLGKASGPLTAGWVEKLHPRDLAGKFSDKFDWITPDEAWDMHDRMTMYEPWTRDQQMALTAYAGSQYTYINNALRKTQGYHPADSPTQKLTDDIHDAMQPTTRPLKVQRGLYADAFEGVKTAGDLEAMVGRTFEEPGFLSTTIDLSYQKPAGRSGSIVYLNLDVPEGTPAAYIGWPGGPGIEAERELLLDHGTRFVITGVEESPDGQRFVVTGRVLPRDEPLTAASAYGEKAGHLIKNATKKWKETLHPRNPNTGEFIDKGVSIGHLLPSDIAISGKWAYGPGGPDDPAANQPIAEIMMYSDNHADILTPDARVISKNVPASDIKTHIAQYYNAQAPKPSTPALKHLPAPGWDPGDIWTELKKISPIAYGKLSQAEKQQLVDAVDYADVHGGFGAPKLYLEDLMAAQVGQGGLAQYGPTALGVGVVPTLGKPIKINTKVVFKTKYAHGQVVAEKLTYDPPLRFVWHTSGYYTKDKFELQSQLPDGSWKEASGGLTHELGFTDSHFGKGALYEGFKDDTGWTEPGSGMPPAQLTKLGQAAQATLPPPPKKIGPKIPTYNSDKVAINKYFNQLTVAQWNSLTTEQQYELEDIANGQNANGNYTPSGVLALVHMAKPSIAVQTLTHKTPDEITVMLNADFLAAAKHLTDAEWNQLSFDQQVAIVNHDGDTGLGGNTAATAHLTALINDNGMNTPSAQAAHAQSLPPPHMVKPALGYTSSTGFYVPTDLNQYDDTDLSGFYGTITPDDWKSFDTATKNYLEKIAISAEDDDNDFPGQAIQDLKAGIAQNLPTPSIPNAPTNLYDTSKVAHVSTIGTPQTNVDFTAFKPLTKDSAHQLQQDMLAKAKKKWTTAETSAISAYTTSVGYQTTNAVLRNDQKRMKLFTDAQLQGGLERAKVLQGAMTPLTQHVMLHRGTGAEAFGFPTLDVDFAKLKAFEGKTITDKGFGSTSVVEPLSSGVGFDYATKKPIKMIIKTPAGTPAVYVSEATPGYSHENEMILGAGTSLRIDSVEPASAQEKAKYGSHVKHIVVATVVPTGANQQSTPLTPNTAPTPTTSKAQVLGGGTPLKISSKLIHVIKHGHNNVIAERVTAGGDHEALIWDDYAKKYNHKYFSKNGTWIQYNAYSKAGAYEHFKNDADWKDPGTLTMVDAPEHDLSSGVSLTPSTPAAAKLPKVDAATLQAQYGAVNIFSAADQGLIYQSFKSGTTFGFISLKTSAPDTYKALATAVSTWNANHSPANHVNMLQMLKIVDTKLTPSGQANQNLYENKIVAWLGTPSGKKIANEFQVGAPPPSAADVLGAANIKLASDIGTPSTTDTNFPVITATDANKTIFQKMEATQPMTSAQKSAIYSYTGSASGTVNNALRFGKGYDLASAFKKAKQIQNAMYPAPRSLILHRGTNDIGVPGLNSFADVQKLVGQPFEEKGFSSASVGGFAAFQGKKFLLEIEVPKGTPGAYVDPVSSNKGEREYMLAAGTKFRVLSVKDNGTSYPGRYIIRVRVIP